jgi:hypothetical protein
MGSESGGIPVTALGRFTLICEETRKGATTMNMIRRTRDTSIKGIMLISDIKGNLSRGPIWSFM